MTCHNHHGDKAHKQTKVTTTAHILKKQEPPAHEIIIFIKPNVQPEGWMKHGRMCAWPEEYVLMRLNSRSGIPLFRKWA